MWRWNGMSHVNGYNPSNLRTQGGCGGWMCNGDAWGPKTPSPAVKTVEFVEFLVLTLVLWVVLVGDPDTETVVYSHNGSDKHPMIGRHNMSITIEAWCNCGCPLIGPAGGGMAGESPIVETGQNAVLVDQDRAVLAWLE